MKLSAIHEPIVEWPNNKPNPGYGLADLDRSHFKYYVNKIHSELNKPIDIPSNYVSLYNSINKSTKISEASLRNFLNDYISRKFASANKFKLGGGIMPSFREIPPNDSSPNVYEFNISKDLILSLVPGNKVQEIYNNANKQLRLYYFGVIRNDPAKAQAEEQKQVQEDIDLNFFTINESRSFYSIRARAFYYNVLLTKKFVEFLLKNFCEAYKESSDVYDVPKREWFGRLEQELQTKDINSVIESMPQELLNILKKAYRDIRVLEWAKKYKDSVPGADELINKTYKTTNKFINYFGSLQELLGNDYYMDFQERVMAS